MFVGIEYELEEIANCKKEMKIYEAGTKRKPHKKSGVSVKLTSKYRNTTYTKTSLCALRTSEVFTLKLTYLILHYP